MKTKSIIFFLLLCITTVSLAQQPKNAGDREKMESLRIAYLTKKLDLSEKEAQGFWPVYNDYREEMDALLMEKRKVLQGFREDKEEMSGSEAMNKLEKYWDLEEKTITIQRSYKGAFAGSLDEKKVPMVFLFEQKFKTFMAEGLRHRQQGRPAKPGRPGRQR